MIWRTAPILEDREVAQQGQDADDDHDHAHDLLGAAVDRQHVDEVKHENDDDERDQGADEERHAIPRGGGEMPVTMRETTCAPRICYVASHNAAASHLQRAMASTLV